MRRQRVKALVPLFMAFLLLTACQKAPEMSDDDEILRAKGSSEDAVAAIVNEKEESEEEQETASEAGTKEAEHQTGTENVCVVLGDGESRMKIEAEIAVAPEALPVLTMQADRRLDEEALRGFLEPQGEVKDVTEKLLADEEAERQRVEEIDKKLGEGSSIVEMSGAGDGSRFALTDKNRMAVLTGRTGGSFEDAALKQKCNAVSKESSRDLDVKDGKAGDASFSLEDAKALLMRKLSVLGIADICLTNAYFSESEDFGFYEMHFVPVVGGLPVAHCFGQQNMENVYPQGMAWVCAEGVAEIGLWNCCMQQVSASKKEKLLSWQKVQEVLGLYLSDGSLKCTADVPFSTAELVYYVGLKDGKLELSPVWSIHTKLEAYVDYCIQSGSQEFAWNIYIDAVTGKLVAVQ